MRKSFEKRLKTKPPKKRGILVVALPPDLEKSLDEAVKKAKTNKSQFVKEAIKYVLNIV